MAIALVTCFYGRAEKVERIIRFYLDQDYLGKSYLLLYNNSPLPQRLDDLQLPDNKRIILVNNFQDLQTGKEYTNTGDIFRDALTFLPDDVEWVNFFDSDDCFLPNHISSAVGRIELAEKESLEFGQASPSAYKPIKSYFLWKDEIRKEHNTLEPSIFVKLEALQKYGFNKTSASYHQAWEIPLKKCCMWIDEGGKPTLIYNWETNHNTFKISGSGDDGETNLKKHREFETDFGSGVLSPAPTYIVERYYKLVEEFEKTNR